MNPNNEVQQLIQLPPVAEQAPSGRTSSEVTARKHESAPVIERTKQQVMSTKPGPIQVPLPLPPIVQQKVSDPPVAIGTISQSNPPKASDDTDLIEKEWVNKAKQIVEHTKDDPYRRSEELTIFKADYMKKRYNKTIKISQ